MTEPIIGMPTAIRKVLEAKRDMGDLPGDEWLQFDMARGLVTLNIDALTEALAETVDIAATLLADYWQDEAARLAAVLARIAACNFRTDLDAIGIARRALRHEPDPEVI